MVVQVLLGLSLGGDGLFHAPRMLQRLAAKVVHGTIVRRVLGEPLDWGK